MDLPSDMTLEAAPAEPESLFENSLFLLGREAETTASPHPNPLPKGEGTGVEHPNPLQKGEATWVERRVLPDRRVHPTSPWRAFWPFGRRKRNRRAGEHQQSYFVDCFPTTTFIMVMLLVAASITDAIFTILLIRAGAKEINPVMNHFLGQGEQIFLMVKYLLTVGGLPLLLVFQNHYLFRTRLRVGHLIPMAVALYGVLIAYQIVLMHKNVLI